MSSIREKIESLRHLFYTVIFQSNTPAGKGFDLVLILCIIVSTGAVVMDSVEDVSRQHGELFDGLEWFFTLLFSLEYGLRIFSTHKPVKYIFSFFGLIDLLAILPSYLSAFIPGIHSLQVVRILRVLRIFRILKLSRFINQGDILLNALSASRLKITLFLFTVCTLLVVFGSAMYIIEGPENGFTNIPIGIYWAVVTLTTVGFGDITPKTDLGRAVSSLVMISGYAIIAVPTGIFSAELNKAIKKDENPDTRTCSNCGQLGHVKKARFCFHCGSTLQGHLRN